MKKVTCLILIFTYSVGFSQKFSLGLLAGTNYNYEFSKLIKNPYIYDPKPTVDEGLRKIFGFYGEYKNIKKISLGLEIKYTGFIKASFQDTNGNPTLIYLNSAYDYINFTPYAVYLINNHWGVSIGIYDNLLLLERFQTIKTPSIAIPLKVSPNTWGATLKAQYKWNKFNIEGGYTYPIRDVSKSDIFSYYVPTFFLQLKYNLSRK